MDALQRAVPLPPPEMVVDALPRREIVWESPPGDPAAQDVEEGVCDLAERVLAGSAAPGRITLQQGAKPLPLRARQVGRVTTSIHASGLHPPGRSVSQHALSEFLEGYPSVSRGHVTAVLDLMLGLLDEATPLEGS